MSTICLFFFFAKTLRLVSPIYLPLLGCPRSAVLPPFGRPGDLPDAGFPFLACQFVVLHPRNVFVPVACPSDYVFCLTFCCSFFVSKVCSLWAFLVFLFYWFVPSFSSFFILTLVKIYMHLFFHMIVRKDVRFQLFWLAPLLASPYYIVTLR